MPSKQQTNRELPNRCFDVRNSTAAAGANLSAWQFGLEALTATSRSIVVTDATQPDNPIVYANAAFSLLTGYATAEIVGRNCRFLQGPATNRLVVAELRSAILAGCCIRRELLNYRKDGTEFWTDLTIDPIRDADGTVIAFIAIQCEADVARLAAEAQAEDALRLDSIARHIPGFIYRRVMRTDGTIDVEYCSPSLGKLLGIEGPVVAQSLRNYVHPDDRQAIDSAIRSSASDLSLFREEYRLVSVDGKVHWLRSDAPPRRRKNGDIVWDGLAIEITAEKSLEQAIANIALRDPLTGLSTRVAWQKALAGQLSAAPGEAGCCGVLYVDMMEFHDLNERFGQRVGDEVLRTIARRLTEIAEPLAGTVARVGGDEFAVLVPACPDEDALAGIARSASDLLAQPMQIGSQEVTVSSRIGAAIHSGSKADGPGGDHLVSELMMRAELALRWAKQGGCSGYMLYSAEQDDRFRHQAILARSLEHAIARGELELHYQPLVDLASGRIVSAEALMRWNHPTLGMQRPDLFIPLAERLGLIARLGRWALEQTIVQRKTWQDAGLEPPPIAINVSANQLAAPDFVAVVEASLMKLGATAVDLELELTEGLLIEPSPQILTTLKDLRNLGFTITVDDFGSGHATFRYLRDFPVDKVKIDQVFVRKLVVDSTDALIIRAVISLARSMGITFVAEGVETEMQREFLLREGCQIGQGYLFSVPLVAADFAGMLANHVQLPVRTPPRIPPDEPRDGIADR